MRLYPPARLSGSICLLKFDRRTFGSITWNIEYVGRSDAIGRQTLNLSKEWETFSTAESVCPERCIRDDESGRRYGLNREQFRELDDDTSVSGSDCTVVQIVCDFESLWESWYGLLTIARRAVRLLIGTEKV